MPIYEYRCQDCRKRVERLVLPGNTASSEEVTCPRCGGRNVKRILSSFAYHRSEADRLAAIDTSKPQHEDYYRDERNVGLFAKKRMLEMGQDPGSDFEGIIEKARKETAEKLAD